MDSSRIQINEMQDFIQEGLKEILGCAVLNEIAARVQTSETRTGLPAFKNILTTQFGELVTRGILIRAGRAGFYYWMRKSGEFLGWKGADFRLLPTRSKVKRAMSDLFNFMNTEMLINAEIHELPKTWHVLVAGLTETNSVLECNFFSGMVQELLSWAGGGKYFGSRETYCQSVRGVCCEFELDKIPLD
ncbi:MAG: hypothetical protein FD147_651 [Chloroflexi bacterium]|nr:MAG: hypothetical protein FD147_651 [Chloroflexota bacterium]